MKRYRVNFRDFLHNRIDFSTTVNAIDMNDACDVARRSIVLPAYVICDIVARIDERACIFQEDGKPLMYLDS